MLLWRAFCAICSLNELFRDSLCLALLAASRQSKVKNAQKCNCKTKRQGNKGKPQIRTVFACFSRAKCTRISLLLLSLLSSCNKAKVRAILSLLLLLLLLLLCEQEEETQIQFAHLCLCLLFLRNKMRLLLQLKNTQRAIN